MPRTRIWFVVSFVILALIIIVIRRTFDDHATRGLPTILSSFLPGQEAGTVPFVVSV